jgi:hypothetical protein
MAEAREGAPTPRPTQTRLRKKGMTTEVPSAEAWSMKVPSAEAWLTKVPSAGTWRKSPRLA